MDEEGADFVLPLLEEQPGDKLFRAILEDALTDLMKGMEPEATRAEQTAMKDSLDWIVACDREAGGFGWLVGNLRLQPEKTKARVLEWFGAGCRREAA